jgi:hypothetical protein
MPTPRPPTNPYGVPIRKRYVRVIEAFMDVMAKQHVDPEDETSVAWCKRLAMRNGGMNRQYKKPKVLESHFDSIWEHPSSRQYLAKAWGMAVGADNGDAIARYATRLDQIAMNTDNEKLAADTIKWMLKTILPEQTHRVQTQSIIAHVSDPPLGYNDSPKMIPTRVLDPATVLADPEPFEANDNEDDDDDAE